MSLLLLGLLLVVVLPVRSQEIVFASSYPPPYSTLYGDGILDQIAREVGQRIGYSITVVLLPAERSLHDANDGVVGGDIARVHGIDEQYENLIRVPEAIIPERDFVAFSNNGVGPIRDWDDLSSLEVAYVRGWKIVEANIGAVGTTYAVDNSLDAFQMLSRDRVDVTINARLDGQLLAQELGIESLVVHEPPLATRELFPYLHHRHRDLVPLIADALREMKRDGTFSAIYQNWQERLGGE